MPDAAEVLCVREQLLQPTGYFDSAIWRWDPPGLQASSLPAAPMQAQPSLAWALLCRLKAQHSAPCCLTRVAHVHSLKGQAVGALAVRM